MHDHFVIVSQKKEGNNINMTVLIKKKSISESKNLENLFEIRRRLIFKLFFFLIYSKDQDKVKCVRQLPKGPIFKNLHKNMVNNSK